MKLMKIEKERVISCRGIVKKLNTYIKADKLLILYEAGVQAAIRKEIAAQFPKAAEFVVSDTAPIKTFDNLEAVVRFLYHSGCQKDSVLLVVGNRQVKELGGFIAASYYCGIAYLYVPLTREASLYDTSDSCGVDLMGMPDVLQSCYAPCMVFRDEAVFELSYHDV